MRSTGEDGLRPLMEGGIQCGHAMRMIRIIATAIDATLPNKHYHGSLSLTAT